MVGEHHSFTSILREVMPHLITIKCVSHSLHLAVENACEVLPRHLEYIVRGGYNLFPNTSRKNPLKIDKLSETR